MQRQPLEPLGLEKWSLSNPLSHTLCSCFYQYDGISTMALSTQLSQHIHTRIAWATLYLLRSLHTFANTPGPLWTSWSPACPSYAFACSSFLHPCSNLYRLVIPLQLLLHYFLVVIMKILKASPEILKTTDTCGLNKVPYFTSFPWNPPQAPSPRGSNLCYFTFCYLLHFIIKVAYAP